MVMLIKKVSKGTRFNQIYLKKNEYGFEPGQTVQISAFESNIGEESIFEYNNVLDIIKKEVVKDIFRIVENNCDYDNILITGSFLEKGFNFGDVDIIVINPKRVEETDLKNSIKNMGIEPHLILIDLKSFNKGISRDPLFRLMVDKYVSRKRIVIKKEKQIDYKLLDIYLIKNKNLIDGYDLLNIKQRKKLLRDFIAIKLFSENRELTIKSIKKETDKIFGKSIIEKLFYYGDNEAKKNFLAKLRKEFNNLESMLLKNVAK